MISPDELKQYLVAAFADADIAIHDRRGTMDHYQLSIASHAFEGLNPLDRQRRVYAALSEPMRDGRLHALEIKTQVKPAS